jgi:hypothetical protein
MPEKRKQKRSSDNEKEGEIDSSSWSEDQNGRGYYYDDAHGYEIYEPNDAKDDDRSEKD